MRAVQAVDARRSEKLWRERMEGFKGAYEQQGTDTLDMKTDMLRQYKTMQVSGPLCLAGHVMLSENKNFELQPSRDTV